MNISDLLGHMCAKSQDRRLKCFFQPLSDFFKTCYYVITSLYTVQVGRVTSSQILILEMSMIPTQTKNSTMNQLQLLSLTLSYYCVRFNSCSEFFYCKYSKVTNCVCLIHDTDLSAEVSGELHTLKKTHTG